MSREKGKRFERAIAALIREEWPDAVVRRASQAERADNPDVFIEGGPPILARLWLELQDSKAPTPEAKLIQAEGDALTWEALAGRKGSRLPVAIWHRLGERTTYVTMRLETLFELGGSIPPMPGLGLHVATISFGAFIRMLAAHSSDVAAAGRTSAGVPGSTAHSANGDETRHTSGVA